MKKKEVVRINPKKNDRPKETKEWTFADWFGEDLIGKVYEKSIWMIFCGEDKGITSFKGAPEVIRGNLYVIGCKELSTLEFLPKKIYGSLFISDCPQITKIDFLPEKVKSIGFPGCGLMSFEGFPNWINGDFCVEGNKLTSFSGCPFHIEGNFNCCENDFHSLEGIPKFIGKNFLCQNNKTTLVPEFIPSIIKGNIELGNYGIELTQTAKWKTKLYHVLQDAVDDEFNEQDICSVVRKMISI